MTKQEAHDALADVLFWMKGYAAGLPIDAPCWRNDDAAHNIGQLHRVQNFINEQERAETAALKMEAKHG